MNRQQRYDRRRALHDLFDGRCAYCCEPTPMPVGTIDHYLPKALGGTWHPKNLRWCCFPCNNRKGDMHPDKWEAVKPLPKARPETAHQRRVRLLSLCAPRTSARIFEPQESTAQVPAICTLDAGPSSVCSVMDTTKIERMAD